MKEFPFVLRFTFGIPTLFPEHKNAMQLQRNILKRRR